MKIVGTKNSYYSENKVNQKFGKKGEAKSDFKTHSQILDTKT